MLNFTLRKSGEFKASLEVSFALNRSRLEKWLLSYYLSFGEDKFFLLLDDLDLDNVEVFVKQDLQNFGLAGAISDEDVLSLEEDDPFFEEIKAAIERKLSRLYPALYSSKLPRLKIS